MVYDYLHNLFYAASFHRNTIRQNTSILLSESDCNSSVRFFIIKMEVFGQCAVLKHGKLNKKKLEISI
jgi:hypothetical protein